MRQCTIAALAAALLLTVRGSVQAAATSDPTGTATLKYDSRGASRVQTPAMIMGHNRFSVGSSSSMGVKVAGKTVKTSVRILGKKFLLGFDRNGDGAISKAEWAVIPPTGNMIISGKSDGDSYVLGLTKMRVTCNKMTVSCWGQAIIRSSMAGSIDRIRVRILDDNMDGQFNQTPKVQSFGDAIQIGSSSSAMPLRAIHRIGKHIYRLKVASDGSSIDYERLEDVELGQVKATFPRNSLRSLIMVGKDSAFDIKTDGLAGIPGGTYRLAYGAVGRSAASGLTFKPSTATPNYDIQPQMMNTMRIGTPLRLDFSADIRGGKVGLSAYNVKVMGSGSEVYGPIDFTRGGNAKPPTVTMLNGRRVVSSSSMKYG